MSGKESDYTLDTLLSMDGMSFTYGGTYVIKIEAKEVKISKGRPHGVKYSLTLHDSKKRRIYGIDNAHSAKEAKKKKIEAYDHEHIGDRTRCYHYQGAQQLIEDFYERVDKMLSKVGVKK